jgi:hypothetical protein
VSQARERNAALKAQLQQLQQEKIAMSAHLSGLAQQFSLMQESNNRLRLDINCTKEGIAALHRRLLGGQVHAPAGCHSDGHQEQQQQPKSVRQMPSTTLTHVAT